MKDSFNFLKDDWKKIPANYRFIILFGAFLIFNSWLLDHWGSESVYLFWGLDIRRFGYSVGLSLILICFTLTTLKQILSFKNVSYFRIKYPLSKLNKEFFLISFRGYVVLFDKETNKYHHIVPFDTAQDLLFVDKWKYVGQNFPPDSEYMLQVGRSNIYHKFDLFKDGGPINTRN